MNKKLNERVSKGKDVWRIEGHGKFQFFRYLPQLITSMLMAIMVPGVRATGIMVDGVITVVLWVSVTAVVVTVVMVRIADRTFIGREVRAIQRCWEYPEGRVRRVRGFLINKNLCFYYWLRKRIGKKQAYRVSNTLEKIILIFGREPFCNTFLRSKDK